MPTVASSAQHRFTTELTNLCRAAPGHPIPAGKPRKPKSRAPPPPAADGQQKWVGLTDVPYVSIRGYGQWRGCLADVGRSRVSAFALKPLNRGTEYCFFLNHQQHEAVAFDLKSVAFFFLGRFWFLLNLAFLIFVESSLQFQLSGKLIPTLLQCRLAVKSKRIAQTIKVSKFSKCIFWKSYTELAFFLMSHVFTSWGVGDLAKHEWSEVWL